MIRLLCGGCVLLSGFNVESIKVPPLEFLVWDVSGQERLRTFWRHYYHGTTGIVFVVDSHDVERLPIAKRELHGILKEEELNEAVLLIIANKTDLPNAVSSERLAQELDLPSLQGRVMHIQPAVAQKGTGLKEGLMWLAKAMKAHIKQQARLQQSGGSGAQPNAVQRPSSSSTSGANSQQQPAYNYLNPYDAQTLNHSGDISTTPQKQQPQQQQQTAPAAASTTRSSPSTTSAHIPEAAIAVPVTVTVVAVPSSSTTSSALLPSSSAAPAIVNSSHSNTAPPLVDPRTPVVVDVQPGVSFTAAPAAPVADSSVPASSSSTDPSLPLTSADADSVPAMTVTATNSSAEQH